MVRHPRVACSRQFFISAMFESLGHPSVAVLLECFDQGVFGTWFADSQKLGKSSRDYCVIPAAQGILERRGNARVVSGVVARKKHLGQEIRDAFSNIRVRIAQKGAAIRGATERGSPISAKAKAAPRLH